MNDDSFTSAPQLRRTPLGRSSPLRTTSLVALVCTCLVSSLCAQAVPRAAPRMTRIEDSIILLSDGHEWKPGLHQIKLVYTFQLPGGVPFYALSGVACTDCDAESGIYVLRPSEIVQWSDTMIGFAYPGRDYEMGSDSANAFRRLFFGHCLKDAPAAAVQFAHEQGRDSSWVDSIRTLVPTRSSMIRRNYPWSKSRARETLDLALARRCHEWQPR